MQAGSIKRALSDWLTMFVVTALSLLLLVYVGLGEGRRIYGQFETEKILAQSRILQSAIETYLRAGLPLKQVVGFNSMLEPLVGLEEVDAAAIYDITGRQLFQVVDKTNPALPAPPESIKHMREMAETVESATHVQIVLPLRTRFETVGSVVTVVGKRFVEQRLRASFMPLIVAVLGLSALFATIVSLAASALARTQTPWLQIGYAITFLAMSGLVVGTLVSLYSEGAQNKAKASAFTLSKRLEDIAKFNLRFRDFDGLDRVFNDYRRLDPEISEAALVIDGVVQVSSDSSRVGRPWTPDPRSYEYTIDMSRPNQPPRFVAVALPTNIVFTRVERSVRNFGALFIASAFLAGLFLQVAVVMQRMRTGGAQLGLVGSLKQDQGEAALAVVKPIFFLAVFLENLTYSFLAKFMQESAAASGISVAFASAPFTAYYLCFALSLIPAGQMSERYGPRRLITLGLVLAGASVLGLALPVGMVGLTGLRALAGLGQGMLFIGVQSYILAVTPTEKKTQGAAIIVFGFQGGMISGMAIGSLLVGYLQANGVFVLAGVIGFVTAFYSMAMIPAEAGRVTSSGGSASVFRRLGQDLKRVVRSGEFLLTMGCIGIPAKAILTGTITFALPLLLAQAGYRQEEVGQIIMLYGIGVVASSTYVSRLVDRTGKTDSILFWGAALSGAGLFLIGLLGSKALGGGSFEILVIVAGVVAVGIAHGFINAPVVTHVAHSGLAGEIGVNPVTSTYRFLERIGHVTGPLLVGQLFVLFGQRAEVVSWIGGGTALLGLLFVLSRGTPRADVLVPKVTS